MARGAADIGVPVEVVHLPRVLAEEVHGVLWRRKPRGVEEAHGAIPGGGGAEGVVGLGPRAVEERVGGREGEDRRRGGPGPGGGEVEDDEVAVAHEAEVLGRGGEEAVLVERAEAHGEARRRGLERRHRGGGWIGRRIGNGDSGNTWTLILFFLLNLFFD